MAGVVSSAAEEEMEALSAIFGEEFARTRVECCEIALVSADESLEAKLQVTVPPGYPESEAPRFGVATVKGLSERMRSRVLEAATSVERPEGEVWVADAAAAARACLEDLVTDPPQFEDEGGDSGWTFCPAYPQFGQKLVRFDAASADDRYRVPIAQGEPLTDRRSTFQAFLATEVHSEAHAKWALRELLSRSKIARATHNIWAYRIRDPPRADNDDDGEDGAGVKVAHILDLFDASGVLVMVSRWYGGIKLGPDRFKHIAKLTQSVLEDNGVSRRASSSSRRTSS